MDITKRFDRILQIFFILQSKSVVTIEELEKRFEISRRTIYRDPQALEQAGVPVTYEPGSGYSIMEGYRIQPSRFTQEEVLSLTIAEKIMQQHETAFVKRHFEGALIKVKSSFHVQQKNVLNDLNDKLLINGGFNSAEYLPNVIDILLNATLTRLIVRISYVKSSDTQSVIRYIEPVGLFYESNFWYVLAFCHLRHNYRNFRLDRIKKVSLTDRSFSLQHLPIDQLRQRESPVSTIRIVIKADRKYAHYLFWERHAFGFKKEEVNDEFVTMYFDCEVHPTSFVRWLMKFVDIVEIIEPDDLKTELAEILKAGSVRINK